MLGKEVVQGCPSCLCPLLSQAQAVAQETMSRIAQNILMLVPRLQLLGYQFAQPGYMFVPPEADIRHRLTYLGVTSNPLPSRPPIT